MTETKPTPGPIMRSFGFAAMGASSLAALAFIGFGGFIVFRWATLEPAAPNEDQSLAGIAVIFMGAALIGAWFFVLLTSSIGSAIGLWSERVGKLILIVPIVVAVVAIPIVALFQGIIF